LVPILWHNFQPYILKINFDNIITLKLKFFQAVSSFRALRPKLCTSSFRSLRPQFCMCPHAYPTHDSIALGTVTPAEHQLPLPSDRLTDRSVDSQTAADSLALSAVYHY
jgi:hypothetical protein